MIEIRSDLFFLLHPWSVDLDLVSSLDYGRLLRVESHPGFDTPYHTPDSILFSIFKAFCEKPRFDCKLSSFDIDYVEYLLLVRFMLIIYFRDNP